MIETRISQHRFAEMDEDQEQQLKETCKKFAHDMRYDFEFEYYAVYFTEENWLLTLLAHPGLDKILTRN